MVGFFMRRASLQFLRCPRCGGGPLEAEGEREILVFGPVACANCGMAYPLADGILDLLQSHHEIPGPTRPSLAQRAMELRTVARFYERGLRPALARLGLDVESERLLFHSLLAPAPGAPILELSCGTARLARELSMRPGAGTVFGLDRSAAMLEEARHQLEESGANLELVRGDATLPPFRDAVLGGVLDVASLHLYDAPERAIREVARILAPGGVYVCAAPLAESRRALDRLERKVGIHRQSEAELKASCETAGLVDFERILFGDWIVFRARKHQ